MPLSDRMRLREDEHCKKKRSFIKSAYDKNAQNSLKDVTLYNIVC